MVSPSIHTHTHTSQLSHASVGFTQAHPNYFKCHFLKVLCRTTLLFSFIHVERELYTHTVYSPLYPSFCGNRWPYNDMGYILGLRYCKSLSTVVYLDCKELVWSTHLLYFLDFFPRVLLISVPAWTRVQFDGGNKTRAESISLGSACRLEC